MVVAGRPPASAPESDEFAATVAAASRGSAPECRALYDAHAGRVCGYLRFNGATDPDDLTSEVFLRVFNHLDDFSGTQDGFRAWVFTIARRVLIDERRRRARRPVTVALSSPAHESFVGGDAELDALQRLGDERVAELLARLTPDQRDVIALRIIADLPINEVADVLGKEPGTIKALQHRAIAALRRHLEMASS
jgi:RNA polymerase sigma-70 factor (ECF subfamily)